ncbi:MAG: hypothetical protein AAF351_03260 [Pseudomonadota bacterium]
MKTSPATVLLIMLAFTSCRADEPTVMPPDFEVNGKGAGEYSADWWMWAMSSHAKVNPVRDLTGEHCAVGQSGDVWFLAGGFGSSTIERTCTVPRGKYLFFPAVNMAFWPQYDNMTYTCKEARASAAVSNDSALNISVTINGRAVKNTKKHRASTTHCFNIYERVPEEIGAYNAFPSASDGYWYMIAPLPTGTYELAFGGQYGSPGDRGGMVQDIKYTLIIE